MHARNICTWAIVCIYIAFLSTKLLHRSIKLQMWISAEHVAEHFTVVLGRPLVEDTAITPTFAELDFCVANTNMYVTSAACL